MVCGVALCAMLKRRVGGKGIRGRDCIASVVRMVGVGVGEARVRREKIGFMLTRGKVTLT